MFASEVSSQSLQTVTWWRGKIAKHARVIELNQFATSDLYDIRWEPLRDASLPEDQLGNRSAEAPDHWQLTYHVVIRSARVCRRDSARRLRPKRCEVCYGADMAKSSLAKLRTLRQSIGEGEASGRPRSWDPEKVKKVARLRKGLMAGLQSPDADNFDIEKVTRRLKKRQRRSSHRPG